MTAPTMIPGIADDGSLFPIEKMEAHRAGQQHLAISVFVFSGSRLLIQQRAACKYHSPGLWANTCCSHPNWGETAQDAARRRLGEELGFSVAMAETAIVEYTADVGGGLVENERVHVFRGDADQALLEVQPNPDEVQAWRWVEAADLPDLLSQAPESLSPWFKIYIGRWNELNL